ncbi:hypothetical protein BKA65DRAFT_543764 [Rhexocercosporidium sp. MPI-PUGE-AT-0058]|nr:hypothetical protein BKA65DRAFT_543764 [Rhexocercosporidium sp. MPI-PUGE-AT-0058]
MSAMSLSSSARDQLIAEVQVFLARYNSIQEANEKEARQLWEYLHKQYTIEITAVLTSATRPNLSAWTFRRWATSSALEHDSAENDDWILSLCEAAYRSHYNTLQKHKQITTSRLCERWDITIWELYLEFGPKIVSSQRAVKHLNAIAKCYEQDSFARTTAAVLEERAKRAKGEGSRSTMKDVGLVVPADIIRAELVSKAVFSVVGLNSQMVTRSQVGQHVEEILGQGYSGSGVGGGAKTDADAYSDVHSDAPSDPEERSSSVTDNDNDQQNIDSNSFAENHGTKKDKGLGVVEGGAIGQVSKYIKITNNHLHVPPTKHNLDKRGFDTPTQPPTREDSPFPKTRTHSTAGRSTRSTFDPQSLPGEAQESSVLSPEIGRKCSVELPDVEDDFALEDLDRWKYQDTIGFSSPFQFDFRNRSTSQLGHQESEAGDSEEFFGVDRSSSWETERTSSVQLDSLHPHGSLPRKLLNIDDFKGSQSIPHQPLGKDQSPIKDLSDVHNNHSLISPGSSVPSAETDRPQEDALITNSHAVEHSSSRAPETAVVTEQDDISRSRSFSIASSSSSSNRHEDQEPRLMWQGGQILLKDIKTLDDDEWLNDEIINYAAYNTVYNVTLHLPQSYKAAIVLENSFFYNNVAAATQTKLIRPELLTPRRKPQLSDADHYVVPINTSNYHWSLVIISYVKCFLEPSDKTPSILLIDPLDTGLNPNKSNAIIIKNLQAFVHQFVKSKTAHDSPGQIELLHARNITRQRNSHDCGIFLLQFLRRFMEKPDEFIDQVRRDEGMIEVGDRQTFRIQLRETLQADFDAAIAHSAAMPERSPSPLVWIPLAEKLQIDQVAQISEENQNGRDASLENESTQMLTAPGTGSGQPEGIALLKNQSTEKAMASPVSETDETTEIVLGIQSTQVLSPVPAPDEAEVEDDLLDEHESTPEPMAVLASENCQTKETGDLSTQTPPTGPATENDQLETNILPETQIAQTVTSNPGAQKYQDAPQAEALKRKQSPVVHASTHDQPESKDLIAEYQSQMEEFHKITEIHLTAATDSLAVIRHKKTIIQEEVKILDHEISQLSQQHTEVSGPYDRKRRQEASLQAFISQSAAGISPDLAPFGIAEFFAGLTSQLQGLNSECEEMNNHLQALHGDLSTIEARMQACVDSLRVLERDEGEKQKIVDGFNGIVELQRRQWGIVNGMD